jgi:hypothetical protein
MATTAPPGKKCACSASASGCDAAARGWERWYGRGRGALVARRSGTRWPGPCSAAATSAR